MLELSCKLVAAVSNPNSDGMDRDSRLLSRRIVTRDVKSPSWEGIEPDKKALSINTRCNLVMCPISFGIGPVNWFSSKMRDSQLSKLPSSVGKVPDKSCVGKEGKETATVRVRDKRIQLRYCNQKHTVFSKTHIATESQVFEVA